MNKKLFINLFKGFVNSTIKNIIENWPGECAIINGRPRHPQTQGLIEQANGTVEQNLRDLRVDHGIGFQWPYHISYIMYSLNTTLQHSIKMPPYQA